MQIFIVMAVGVEECATKTLTLWDNITEFPLDELNLIVMGQIPVNTNIREVTACWRHVPYKEWSKSAITFCHHGVKSQ